MNINDIAVSLIKSEQIRSELINNKHQFKVDEQISLIYNSNLELLYKLQLFTYLLKDGDISDDIKIELSAILSNIENFYTSLYSDETIFMFNDWLHEAKITKSFKYLQEYIKEHYNMLSSHTIAMINSEIADANNNVIYYFSFNKDGQVVKFYTLNDNVEYITTNLEKAYVNIPNNICEGDIITIIGSEEEYVVVNESKIPEHLISNCTIGDASLTVINKDLVSDYENGYTVEIDNMFRNRINCLKNECKDNNRLNSECKTVSLLSIDKIFKNILK